MSLKITLELDDRVSAQAEKAAETIGLPVEELAVRGTKLAILAAELEADGGRLEAITLHGKRRQIRIRDRDV